MATPLNAALSVNICAGTRPNSICRVGRSIKISNQQLPGLDYWLYKSGLSAHLGPRRSVRPVELRRKAGGRSWRDERESNSHLNLGKVSDKLQKRRKWRLFQRF